MTEGAGENVTGRQGDEATEGQARPPVPPSPRHPVTLSPASLLRALASAGLAAWAWDPATDTWTGTNVEAVFGVPEGSFDRGFAAFLDLVHPDDRGRLEAEVAEALRSRDTFNFEFRLLLPDGAVRWAASLGGVERGPGGAARLHGVSMDVTEKKAYETRLLRAQRLEAIGTLAGGIAHDLNNVLTPIRLGADLLRRPLEPDRREALLDAITFSVKRGVDLLAQILDFARGEEAGLVSLAPGPVLTAVGRLLEHTLPRSVALEVSAPADLGRIKGDLTQLSQVLVNLAVNARDAMPQGGRLSMRASNVTVDEALARAHPEARPGRYVLVSVADTGVGMAPEVLDRIFDPFFTTKEVGKGTGLGLSLVRGIVRRHEGFLDVESAPGGGTTVRVWLPVTDEPAAGAPAEPPLPAGGQQVILVVDDEARVRATVQEALEGAGYRVLTAANGAEGLALFNQRQAEVALVLVDLSMPVLDGLTTIRALRQAHPDVPILPASGLPPAPGALEGLLKRPAFLPKPFTAAELLQAVRDLLPPPSSPGDPPHGPHPPD